MRILLWNSGDGRYVKSREAWTAAAEEAFDFKSTARAISFAVELHLSGVEVVLAFENPQYNIRLPLKPLTSHGGF